MAEVGTGVGAGTEVEVEAGTVAEVGIVVEEEVYTQACSRSVGVDCIGATGCSLVEELQVRWLAGVEEYHRRRP